jgi:hypothetical protein
MKVDTIEIQKEMASTTATWQQPELEFRTGTCANQCRFLILLMWELFVPISEVAHVNKHSRCLW